MDQNRFDTLTRSLSTTGSRRRALAAILGGSWSLLGWHGGEDAAAHNPLKSCKKKSGKQKKKCIKKAKQHNATHVIAPPPPCQNGAKDGTETDFDCGGTCPLCALGKSCVSRNDCATALCSGGRCGACADDADCGKGANNELCFCSSVVGGGPKVCTVGTSTKSGFNCDECPPGTVCVVDVFPPHGLHCYQRCGAA